jgi:hypothetical protein
VAHVFDTGMDTPQRTVIRQGLVSRLEALKAPLYVRTVKGFHTRVRGDDQVAQLLEHSGGQLPALFVYCGRKATDVQAVRGDLDRHLAELTVHVYVVVNNLRSPLSRIEADVAALADDTKDPGIDVILEHVYELLIGYKVPETDGSQTIYELRPSIEDEVEDLADATVWEQQWTVKVQRDPDRTKGITQLIEEVQSTHHQDGSPTANDVVATTEIGP